MKKAILIAGPILFYLVIVGMSVSDEGGDVRTPKVGIVDVNVPEMMNYQGVLTDDTGAPLSTTVSMTFTIYDAETEGEVLWTETHGFITTIGGFFDVLLGSITPIPLIIFNSPDRWLGVAVGGDPEMIPRQQITSSAYAYYADAVSWHHINDMPAGFADGTDDEGAGGDITAVDAGDGLTGGGTTGDVTLSLEADYRSGSAYDSLFVNEADLDHLDAHDGDPSNVVYVTDEGVVCIGSQNPYFGYEELYIEDEDDDESKVVVRADDVATYWAANSVAASYSYSYIGTHSSHDFKIKTKNTSRITIKADGNVGIGTQSPSYTLDVNGDINTTGEVRKNGTAYNNPDYVFELAYELMSLKELKEFIAEKRHLPNMPSAEEIKREGVRMFEQNRLLLEKLEEAYLYIFQLEERIAKLEEKTGGKHTVGE